MTGKTKENEVLERIRRIETRVTHGFQALGVDTRSQKPVFDYDSGCLTIPSMHSSLKEILAAIPVEWHGTVVVQIGTTIMATISRDGTVLG